MMPSSGHVIVVLVGLLAVSATRKHKPASHYFKVCHRSDPDFKKCLLKTVEELHPTFVKGVPELDIPRMDPMNIPRLEYRDGSGAFEFWSVHTNVTVRGAADVKIQSVDVDLQQLTMELNTSLPFMRLSSNYEIGGKILLLPIYGKGDCQFNITDIVTTAQLFGKLESRDGEEYLSVHDVQLVTDISGATVKMNNLFNGNKQLGDAANGVFNENWREAFETYKHLATETFGVLFKQTANNLLNRFPFKELYPE